LFQFMLRRDLCQRKRLKFISIILPIFSVSFWWSTLRSAQILFPPRVSWVIFTKSWKI
jgi:hypothetical protein